MRPPTLTRGQLRHAIVLILVGTGLPVMLALAGGGRDHLAPHLLGAAIAVGVPLAVVGFGAGRPRLGLGGALLGPAGITLLQAHQGGIGSSSALLLVLPAIWLGVQGSPAELRLAGGTLVACCFGPMLVVGAPAYPVDWIAATLVVFIVGAVAAALAAVTREILRTTAALRRTATQDALTELLNRRGWYEHAGRELARVRRRGGAVSVVALDLDAFKAVNDLHGHHAGDRVLQDTAKLLQSAFRTGDVVARLGGDEFGVLLADTEADTAVRAIRRLQGATPADGAFSAGVARADDAESLDALLRRADDALYAAKAGGPGITVLAGGERRAA